jgi:aspartate/glutamate racemase
MLFEKRAKYDIPFIGIEPAIKPAATNSKNKIGILATQGTLISELFNKTAQQFQTQNHRPSRPWISTAYRKRKNVFGRNDRITSFLFNPYD